MSFPSTRGLIPRPALVGAFTDAICANRLIAIHGPAGYGKTSACALALASEAQRTAWYTAQLWQAGNFVEPLVAEVRKVREDFGRLTLALAGNGRPPIDSPDVLRSWAQRVGATFADELRYIPDRIFIVIEDYHLLDGDLGLAQFIIGAMRVLPEHVTCIVIGRTSPPLPLAEWIAQGRAAVFDADDLRFGPNETLALARLYGLSIDEQRANAICAQCEGWGAGIALLMRTGSKPLPTQAGSQPATSAYLVEQYIATLPPELNDFLEHVAVLETVQTSAIEGRPGLNNARASLQMLERRGAMLTAARSGETYHIHPLLREAVLTTVRNRDGELGIARLHRWAAGMLEANAQIAPALFHAERGGDDRNLVRLLATHTEALFSSGHGDDAANALHDLMKRGVEVPGLAERVGALRLRERGLSGARELLTAGLRIAETRHDDEEAFALRALLLEDALNRLEPLPKDVLDRLIKDATARGGRSEAAALVLAGWTDVIDANFQAALEKGVHAYGLAVASQPMRYRAALLQAYAVTCLGDFIRADEIMSELLRDLEQTDHIVLLCYTLSWYARLALGWGDATAAADYAEQGAKLGSNLNLPSELAGLYVTLAEVYASAGDRVRCEEAASSTRRHAASAWYAADRARMVARAGQMVARAAFCAGEKSAALDLIRKSLGEECAPAQHASMLTDEALYAQVCGASDTGELFTKAANAVAQAPAVDAVDAVTLASSASLLSLLMWRRKLRPLAINDDLKKLAPFRRMLEQRQDIIELQSATSALHTIAAAENADHMKELALLATCHKALLAVGFRFEGDALLEVVTGFDKRFRDIVSSVEAGSLLELETARAGVVPSPMNAPRGAMLTKREQEVLGLVAFGLTNKEIAQRLTLSRRTIDTHVEHVLGKLNATTRTRAVAEARRAGQLADASTPVAM